MASVVDELNELLTRERGEAEAVRVLQEELADTDPDIAESAEDVLSTASWSCSGLYHRITQLDGTPNLDATDLAEQVAEVADTKAKLDRFCSAETQDHSRIAALLKRRDLDETTRSFLEDLLRAHEETAGWCKFTLSEWEVDIK